MVNPPEPTKGISRARIVVWVIVAGVGLYLVISGVMGILVKAG